MFYGPHHLSPPSGKKFGGFCPSVCLLVASLLLSLSSCQSLHLSVYLAVLMSFFDSLSMYLSIRLSIYIRLSHTPFLSFPPLLPDPDTTHTPATKLSFKNLQEKKKNDSLIPTQMNPFRANFPPPPLPNEEKRKRFVFDYSKVCN